MGTDVLRRVLRRCSAAGLTIATSCAHAPPPPPAAPRVVILNRRHLPDKPAELKGNTRRVKDGVFCTGDGAFALPIVPFPEGPTEIDDQYEERGVTSVVNMLDAKESVVEVVRTQIRPDRPEKDVLPGVAAKLQGLNDPIHAMSVEWIRQNGRTEVQTVNPAEEYTGRADIMYLTVSHGWSNLPGNCRVDRHFVGAGYYFQIIAIVHQPQGRGAPKYERDSCEVALELAAWTSQNIRVGQGCGE